MAHEREEQRRSLQPIINRLETMIKPSSPTFFDPFDSKKGGLDYLNTRMVEGSFGRLASKDRSYGIENHSQKLLSGIKEVREDWHKVIGADKVKAEKLKSDKIDQLKQDWEKIKKGGKEEEKWIEEAIGLTTAFFEDHIRDASPGFELWDNQLLYVSLMTAGEGKYSFGNLLSNNRAVQLDTGEGKTKCSGVIAAVDVIKDKPVIIIEQNYVSAETHAKEMAPFFERFLKTETGVLTDKSEGKKIITDVKVDAKTGMITEEKRPGEYDRQAFIYSGGEFHPQQGINGRERAWKKKIVYTDINSLGIDSVTDRQITTRPEKKMQPSNFKNHVALIQEADSLMVDEAINPFEIEAVAEGDRAWKTVADYLTPRDGKPLSTDETISYIYNLWANLEIVVNKSPLLKLWQENNSFLASGEGQVIMEEEDVIQKIEDNILPSMAGIFGDDEAKARKYMEDNRYVTEIAVETILGQKPYRDFLPEEEPILMDRYGIPLDNRELSNIRQVFLQLRNVWERRGLNQMEITPDVISQSVLQTLESIKVPERILNKVLPSVLFREFGELRATSGSLLPVAGTMADVYEAETLTISRHKKIENENVSKDKLTTLCLDGGTAEIDFVPQKDLFSSICRYVNEIRSQNQAGLIIMPDITSAKRLAEFIGNFDSTAKPTEFFDTTNLEGIKDKLLAMSGGLGKIKVITGQEEYKKRGSLEKMVEDLNVGDIIITTQIAHRDIDPKLSKEVVENGGLMSMVYSPPNERGLWQALQRSIRADVPGRRLLLLDEATLSLAKNRYLLGGSFKEEDHEKRIKRFDELWEKSLKGDIKAQTELFDSYLGLLRFMENQTKDSILFGTVKERHLDALQDRLWKYTDEGEKRYQWDGYIDFVAYKHFANRPGVQKAEIPPIDAFLNLKTDEERRNFLQNLGVYGNMDYARFRGAIDDRLASQLWSDFLEVNDYLFSDFSLDPNVRRAANISQYETFWRDRQISFINTFDIQNYARELQKAGALDF